jgi:hypothetical protein
MTDPKQTAPLPPLLNKNMYNQPEGTQYELIGFKGTPDCPD